VVHDSYVIVVGGSTGAVACACEAAKRGARVFLLAPRPYLGSDICATLRLWLEEGEQPESKLAVACFGENRTTTPYRVKAAMDRALVDAGVPWLTGCYATDVLRDRDGRIAGVVMANRSGRQAVRGKVVIDATDRAVVARLAGAEFRPFQPGPQGFRRVVIGGRMRSGDGVRGEKKTFPGGQATAGGNHDLPIYDYTLRIDLTDNRPQAFLHAEHRARAMTFAEGCQSASETPYYEPHDTVVGEERVEVLRSRDPSTPAAFRPKGTTGLYVLGAYADVGGEAAATLLRPVEWMDVGRRIGQAAAKQAAALPAVPEASLPDEDVNRGIEATVGEALGGIRPTDLGTIRSGRRRLPVLGRYDVVVVGGGTAGAPAGIAAARSGAKTLVVEYLHELGGVGTAGLIGKYWRGLRRGFTAYIDEEIGTKNGGWNVVEKAEWYRRELIDAGADVWFGTLACGAVADEGQVRGVVVATPFGRGAVLADVVIDASGNSDVAACAGAKTRYGISEQGSLNVQIAGFPDRPLGKSYVNTCYTLVDDTDVLDVWHLMTWKRATSASGKAAFDVGQLIDSRERRRIVGDYTLTTHDILAHRSFPDTISQHYSNFDAAAFPDARLLLLADAKGPNFHTDLPYRCLLPEGLDGLLVVGLGCSADRDAMTLIRMQPDLQNQGYAAGLAAAAAARVGGHTRRVDVKTLQKQLVAEDVLDQRVLTDGDSFPATDDAIERAVAGLGVDADQVHRLHWLAFVVAHPDESIGPLRHRYREARDVSAKRRYARVLGILGDPTGAATLVEAIDAHEGWDRGVPLSSQRKTGNTFSELDRLVIALGFSRDPEGLPTLIAKLRQLKPGSELSHFKAISLALRHHAAGDAAVELLLRLLDQPGFTGHATPGPWMPAADGRSRLAACIARRRVTGNGGGSLNDAYKELIVAAMLYRGGDPGGAASKILRRFTQDVHGHFARYAERTLESSL